MKEFKSLIICILAALVVLSGCGNVSNDTTTNGVSSEFQISAEPSATVGEQNITEQKITEKVTDTTENTTTSKAETTTAASKETTKPKKNENKTTKPTRSETTSTTKRVNSTEKITTTKSNDIKTTVPTSSVPKTTISTTSAVVTEKADVCFVTIICDTINKNQDMLKESKKAFVPSDGIILKDTPVEIDGDATAFDVIKKACSDNTCKANCKYCQRSGIQIEYTYTPAFANYYIEGIHQIYEKDCGKQSGWMYSVNGEFPNVGASSCSVKAGDKIVFAYTCDMGEDIGNIY